ncbi:PAAR motif-containing protein [Streptoalloteichus tenebrarius]|uniref:PAAR motif-containing protein n=1 Tax=Streptoalloteichus tenebrarius (strain ATCC 17920 / DSM 40477 / JCM 4838 / CBS 697.72 / NBRC 16177 / NCIMB 11028 / NRRL B-12390 / A12253. 1 / ISP 5477) TaxID=1933 RepID=A0ABT1HNT8_STRSD|nr:PAAR domain-containing protein [Streptoalloteichus tenebrarius]MCP2257175.1 PAAR motif-containing protein [Streptoalloteichus tenebrarius]BFE98809.1 PAAR domain-containing protein [Streptoalloteichus tenebrarius]
MGKPAAKLGDRVTALDTHLIQPPGTTPPVPVPHPFNGMLLGQLSRNVRIERRPAAILGSTATNIPPHIPQGGTFVKPPTNQGRVILGSLTVRINGKPAVRAGDLVMTCNDPVDLPVGRVIAVSTVRIGG